MIINVSELIMNILLHFAYIEKIHTHYSFNPLYLLNKVSVIYLVMKNWSQYIFNHKRLLYSYFSPGLYISPIYLYSNLRQ